MKRKSLEDAPCPVARTLDVIGDWWSLLIVRDAFDGVTRFSEFQKGLGMAKNILATRLRALVTHGVLEIVPAADGSAYQEYVLTEKGRALFPVIVGLRQWGRSSVRRGRGALNAGGKRQRPPCPAPDADRQRRADAHPAEYPGGEGGGTVMRVSGGARSSPAEKPGG